MTTPEWLAVGSDVVDESDDQWLVQELDGGWVTLQHPDRGRHRVRRGDLVEWVASGRWDVVQ